VEIRFVLYFEMLFFYMRINWLHTITSQSEDISSLIQEEYKFQSRITRILVSRMKDYKETDLKRISFDFDTRKKSFKVCSSTPEPLYSELLKIEGES